MKVSKFETESAFFYENGFMLTSEPYRLANIISHYELYKKIIELPGDVVELGVFKGSSFIQMATFREFLENSKSRKIIGFDTFGAFPKSSEEALSSDEKFIEKWNQQFCEEFVSKEEIESCLDTKKFDNYELIQGDICKTIPQYLQNNPHLRIALLHIDVDVYHPAKVGLELLFDRVVPGGVIIFDDYGTLEGETRAIEEFFEGKGYILRKLNCSQRKPSYIIKNSL